MNQTQKMRIAPQFTFLKYDSQFLFFTKISIKKIKFTKKIRVIESLYFYLVTKVFHIIKKYFLFIIVVSQFIFQSYASAAGVNTLISTALSAHATGKSIVVGITDTCVVGQAIGSFLYIAN